MPNFKTILELTVKAKTQAEADGIADGAAEHLRETFNDDGTIKGATRAAPFHLFYIEASDSDGVHAYMVARGGKEKAAKAEAERDVLQVLSNPHDTESAAAVGHCHRICSCDAELFETVGLLADC